MASFLIAYSKLLALKSNLPNDIKVEAYYVDQYHAMLDSLKDVLGDDVGEFQMEASEIDYKSVGYAPRTGTRYSKKKYCDRHKLLAKIDGLLNYLTLQSTEEDRKKIIGFRDSQIQG